MGLADSERLEKSKRCTGRRNREARMGREYEWIRATHLEHVLDEIGEAELAATGKDHGGGEYRCEVHSVGQRRERNGQGGWGRFPWLRSWCCGSRSGFEGTGGSFGGSGHDEVVVRSNRRVEEFLLDRAGVVLSLQVAWEWG
jgi:hypothetical protein